MKSYLPTSAFALLLVLAVRAQAWAGEPQWIEITSPHFSVVTDAGENRGREVVTRFEQMRAVFSTLMTKANVSSPIPLQIVAFRNGKELRQFAPLWKGKPVAVDGLFIGGDDRNFILLDMSVESPWAVVFHEYAHQLMNGVLTSEVAPWFEEGFAEYFSSIEVDSKEARVGKIPESTYQIMQQFGAIKMADLLRVRQQSSTYNESGDHRTVFYAESSMLVHYMYDNHLIPNLGAYFNLTIDKNVPVEDALQQSLGMSTVQLDRILRTYVVSGHYMYYPIPTPASIGGKDYPSKPLGAGDSAAILADIHLHSPDYREKAAAEFQEILKTDPKNAAACRGLGYIFLQSREFEKAAEYFKRAASADLKDPRVHYYSALLMSREGSFSDESQLADLTKEFNTAIALDPTFADSYMLLAFAQSRAGDPAKGLITMQKAVMLSPRNENYRYNLAQMYLNDQKPELAITILQMLSNSGSPDVAQRAANSLVHAQEFMAELQSDHDQPVGHAAPEEDDVEDTDASVAVPSLGERPKLKFLKGTIMNVDCKMPPAATMTVISDAKTWKMQVSDSKNVLVMGADQFSCGWNKQKVALNYSETGESVGSVVSIEIQ